MAERVDIPKTEIPTLEEIDALMKAKGVNDFLKDDVPPKAKATRTAPPKDKPTAGTTGTVRTAGTRKDLTPQLVEFYSLVGTMAMFAAKDKPVIAEQILKNAQNCAEEVNKLAQTNPKIHAAIVKMMTGGATAAVITAHLPIVAAIAISYVPQAAPLSMFLDSEVLNGE